MECPESRKLSSRKCIECKVSKDPSCFYSKAANRLDTVCKDCRKQNKKARYHTTKIDARQVNQATSHVIRNEDSKGSLELNTEEFHSLIDVIGILLKIDRRLKGEE